jgi:DeoR/GlpR family transcriptional regulator of sugar metabolism
MVPEERERKILDLLEDQGKIAVPLLVARLNVSEATIRRDLGRLAARHAIQRVHGGAMSLNGVELEPPVLKRASLHAAEKHRIGEVAAGLIANGDTVTLLGGSTTLEVSLHLREKKNLTVITDSLLIAQNVVKQANINLIVLGGGVDSSELKMEGSLTQLCLRELHANKLIFGVRAVNFNQGLMLDRMPEVTIFRECMKAAAEAILVVDHSKFGQVATAVLGPLTAVSRVVTDRGVPPEAVAKLRGLGIDVVLA